MHKRDYNILEYVHTMFWYTFNSNIVICVCSLGRFASVEVMHQYGILLENFENNGKFTNDCIFTMMHHIGGDIDHVATLFQPIILKTFSKIWESDYEICDVSSKCQLTSPQ